MIILSQNLLQEMLRKRFRIFYIIYSNHIHKIMDNSQYVSEYNVFFFILLGGRKK